MKQFFTSDWHLNHFNIIRYTNRPCKTITQMHEMMQFKNNQIVSLEDEVWNIGDVTLLSAEFSGKVKKEILKFNGAKHLVLGNHDSWKPESYERVEFSTIHTAFWFKYKDFTFYLMHDPSKYTVIENDPKAIMLCGHVHKLFKHLLPKKRVINVGVDVWDFEPVEFGRILSLLEEHKIL